MCLCLTELADVEENASLRQIHSLISAACEYLGLWKILCEHQLHVIANNLSSVSLVGAECGGGNVIICYVYI